MVIDRGSPISNPAGQPFYIGVGADGASQKINGYIEKVAVWGVELSSGAVVEQFTASGPPYFYGINPTINMGDYTSAADLIGYWNFDDWTGNTALELSGNSKPVVISTEARFGWLGFIEPVTYYIVVDTYAEVSNNLDPPSDFMINVWYTVPPFITGFTLEESNNYVDITINESCLLYTSDAADE